MEPPQVAPGVEWVFELAPAIPRQSSDQLEDLSRGRFVKNLKAMNNAAIGFWNPPVVRPDPPTFYLEPKESRTEMRKEGPSQRLISDYQPEISS